MAYATNILWETDGNYTDLPSIVKIPSQYMADTETISEFLSGAYGYLNKGFIEEYTIADIKELWEELEDVTFHEDGESKLILASDWKRWKKGTCQSEIWNWFNVNSPSGIIGLVEDISSRAVKKLLTWDDIYLAADGAGYGDYTLAVKDNAHYNVKLLALDIGGSNLDEDECPEDTIEYICNTLHVRFNEIGEIIDLEFPEWIENIVCKRNADTKTAGSLAKEC